MKKEREKNAETRLVCGPLQEKTLGTITWHERKTRSRYRGVKGGKGNRTF